MPLKVIVDDRAINLALRRPITIEALKIWMGQMMKKDLSSILCTFSGRIMDDTSTIEIKDGTTHTIFLMTKDAYMKACEMSNDRLCLIRYDNAERMKDYLCMKNRKPRKQETITFSEPKRIYTPTLIPVMHKIETEPLPKFW